MRSRRPGIGPLAAVAFGVGFAIWTGLALTGALAGLDTWLPPRPNFAHPLTQIAAAIAVFFEPAVVYAALLGIAIWGYRRRLLNLTVGIVAAVAVGWLASFTLRWVIAQPRPATAIPELFTNSGYGYPSGHMAAIVTAALVAIATTTTTRQSRLLIELGRWLGIGLVLVIALDRWVLHAHTISQIIGGILLGGFTASLTLSVARVHMQPDRPVRDTKASGDTSPRLCAVVVNPTKIPDWAAFRRHVEWECAENGWTAMWLETTAEDPGRGMAKAALERGAEMVLAAGGDGTVRVVCSVLAGSGVPVALVPSGTGNLLARNLGVPLDQSEALTVAFGGEVNTIDLVKVRIDDQESDEYAAVMAGIGLDARIMGGTDDGLKKLIGPAAYVVAAREAANHPMFDVSITLDDNEPLKRKAGIVMVGNVGNLTGGVTLIPDAEFDDGLLDLFVASPKDSADWVRVTTSVLLPIPEAPEVDRGQGTHAVIEVDEPLPFQMDGDTAGECRRIEATLRPQCLMVMVPAR